MSYPSRSRRLFTSNRFPSTENRDTWESLRMDKGMEDSSRQFSSRRRTFRRGHAATSADRTEIWSERRTMRECGGASYSLFGVLVSHSVLVEL